MKGLPVIVSVDFDGTITQENDYPTCGALMPKAKEAITALHDKHGCIIILNTCRAGEPLADALEYCKRHGIPIDHVNEQSPQLLEIFKDTRKVYADYYIDDLNLGGFPGWEEAYWTICVKEGWRHLKKANSERA